MTPAQTKNHTTRWEIISGRNTLLYKFLHEPRESPVPQDFAVLIAVADAVILALWGLWSLLSYVGVQLSEVWQAVSTSWPLQFLGTLVLVAISIWLYRWKVVHRASYGAAEFVFAFVVGFGSVGAVAAQGMAALLGVVSSAYLMVRGIDNFMEGRKALAQMRTAALGPSPGKA
jgi:hypothetical protein